MISVSNDQEMSLLQALSGVSGSISIACWIVVFSPQIWENFQRSSAKGLSLHFLVIWLLGDVCNILGALLQGVLPTMLILAVYYTIADIVLLGQCLYYRQRDRHQQAPKEPEAGGPQIKTTISAATPLLAGTESPKTSSSLKTSATNAGAVLLVSAVGVLGWFLSQQSSYPQGPHHHRPRHRHRPHKQHLTAAPVVQEPRLNVWGQIFGYFCASLYLGSRLPQLLLNYRRKSTEGISILFFIFACVGNATYVLSILVYQPDCKEPRCGDVVRNYLVVNLSWLLGSAGTLLLDLVVFLQFWLYRIASD